MTTRTSNDGPREVSETLTQPATNASAIMISDVFMDVFMPPKITADRGGGQAPSVGRLSVSLS